LELPAKKHSADWNFDLSVFTRCTAQRGNNSIDVATQHRPLGISKDNDGDLAQGQILLKSYILSAVMNTSKPAASAASSKAPFPSASHPRSTASTTTWFLSA